jgi:N-acetylneuraminate synthase/sialic acid synthase
MKRELIIDNIRIADDTDPFVIAEVGNNHQGDLEKCKELFRRAKECGCTAVKLQKRDNASLYTKAMLDAPYNSENAFGATYGEHREALEFGRDEYLELKQFCRELDILFFATAWDFKSADFLAELDMPVFKMASGDLRSIPLLKYVAKLGKPMIVSTGGGSLEDILRAYEAIMPINTQLAILQCTASYPVEPIQMNLRVITNLRERLPDVVIGLSDHQNGIALAPVAYALGARVIEKHFTLNRAWKGTDHAFSLEPVGMTKMVRDLHRTREALGDGHKRAYENEIKPLNKMAKKLVAARDLPQGHLLGVEDVALKSPNDGLPPYELDRLLGRKLTRALKADDNLRLEDVSLTAEAQPAASTEPARPRRKVAIAPELRERIMATRSVVFDFDGVFTDGAVYVGEDGHESVRCNRSDGLGLQRLAELGLDLLILSTETNPVVSARAAKLKVACLHGQRRKIEALKGHALERGLSLEQIAYVGNDINDSECLKAVGLPIVVHDAWPEVARLARLRTERPGGQGAVREICDLFFAVLAEERAE